MRNHPGQIVTIALSLAILLFSGYIYAEDQAKPGDDENQGDKVYKSVSPSGETIYSDKPLPGSQEVTVPAGGTYKPVKPPAGFKPYQPVPAKPASKPIDNTVSITSPQNGATIWSGPGELSVSVSVASGLDKGQKLEYQIDGKTVLTGVETSHTFQNIIRGEHVLTVRITDPSGSSQTSPPVTVYMRRPFKKK